MDILAQSALIVAVISFTLAITALTRNLLNRVVMAYAVVCGVISFWAFSFFFSKTFDSSSFYTAHLFFHLLLAPSGLFFVQVLTRANTSFLRWLWRLAAAFAVGGIFLLFSKYAENDYVKKLVLFSPSFLVLACLHLMYIDWQLGSGLLLKPKTPTVGLTLTRRNWIYAGAMLLLGAASMDHVSALGEVVPSLGNLFLCFYLFMISEAIIHQRLLNIQGLLGRVLVQIFLSTCLTVIYSIFVSWVDSSPARFILNTFVASFAILMIIDPIRKLTSIGLLKFLSTKYLIFEQSVEKAQMQLVGALDTVGLSQLTLQFLDSVLKCESASVFVLRSDGSKFRRIRGIRDDGLENREILKNFEPLNYVLKISKREEAPVVLDSYIENELLLTTSKSHRESYDLILKGMRALNANILIPFLDTSNAQEGVLGFVAVRSLTPPEPWGNNWGVLQIIYPYFVQAARQLKNMDIYVRLREKDRLAALGEMAAGLAHEIRNPLGAIKGAAQFLETQKNADPSNAPFLSVIVEEVNRLNKVVAQFLDYSKPYSAEVSDFKIGELLEKVIQMFKAQNIEEKEGIQIKLIYPQGEFEKFPMLRGSAEQIKQVLVNLIQNSIQALKKAGYQIRKEITVGAYVEQRLRDGKRELVFFVEDNGTGISKENIEKIFIPFFTTDITGTGLGLSICSKIIEAHGGRIEVISEQIPDKSFSRFLVHLPALD